MIQLTVWYNDKMKNIHFPCSEKELQSALGEIGVSGEYPAKLFVKEVDYPKELGFLQDRFINMDEVNYLAKRFDSFCGSEDEQYFEAMKKEQFQDMKDLINLTFNLNRYTLIQDISSMGKIGREYVLNRDGCVPAHDEDDPKYAEIGRQLMMSDVGIFTEHGILIVSENIPFREEYDGQVFPPYLYDPDMLLTATAEYGGKTEYLYLPCEDEAIRKAFLRLGVTDSDEVKITLEDFNTKHSEWFQRLQGIAKEESISAVNDFIKAINTTGMDLDKLWSLAEYAQAEDTEELIKLAENIDCFTFISGVTEYKQVGEYMVENNEDYHLNPELEDFFDFEEFGEYIAREKDGRFVCNGFICNDSDRSLNEILYQDNDMTMGVM